MHFKLLNQNVLNFRIKKNTGPIATYQGLQPSLFSSLWIRSFWSFLSILGLRFRSFWSTCYTPGLRNRPFLCISSLSIRNYWSLHAFILNFEIRNFWSTCYTPRLRTRPFFCTPNLSSRNYWSCILSSRFRRSWSCCSYALWKIGCSSYTMGIRL